MNDDVIKLLTSTYTVDEYGNQIETVTERTVFCTVLTVGRTEFYQAAQADLRPEYVFVLSHYKDYHGEKDLIYTDWSGRVRRFSVLRAYRPQGADRLELTAAERIGENV